MSAPAALHAPDVHAERALLGALMHLPVAQAAELLDGLEAGALADTRHRSILTAIRAAVDAGEQPDPVVVHARLLARADGVLFLEGDPRVLLGELYTQVPVVSNAGSYLRMVLDSAGLREREERHDRMGQALAAADVERFDELALGVEAGTARASSWAPVDLEPYLTGTHEPLKPSIGLREDGVPLLYAARVHSVAGESEAGKSMFSLHLARQQIEAGHDVIYLDLEDSADSVVQRLFDMGLTATELRRHFHYRAPSAVLTAADERALAPFLERTSLVVLDATTEALAMYDVESKDDTKVAGFYRALPRRLAAHGPAVLLIDHVVKDADSRGRYATGSQHKLAGITGAAYGLEAVQPFAVGVPGRSRLVVHKDRPGQVRPHTVPIGRGRHWLGDFTVTPVTRGYSPLEAALEPPSAERPDFRPTVLMTRVSEVLQRVGKPLGSRELLDRVKGRADDIRSAIAALEDDGYITVETGPRNAKLHALVKPYPDPEPEEN